MNNLLLLLKVNAHEKVREEIFSQVKAKANALNKSLKQKQIVSFRVNNFRLLRKANGQPKSPCQSKLCLTTIQIAA